MRKKWSPEEVAELAKLRAKKTKPPEIARLLNNKFWEDKPVRSPTAVIRCLDNNRLSIAKCREIADKDPKTLDATTQKMLGVAKDLQEVFKEEVKVTQEFEYSIQTESKWVGIIHSGDWHLEGGSVDLKSLEEDIVEIGNYSLFYTIFMGDGGDYFMGPLASSQFDTTLPPRIARLLFFKLMNLIGDRLIALLTGDHEYFAKNLADFDIISDTAKKMKKRYMGWGGTVHIKTGDVEYIDAVRHRYRFNSSFNPLHTCRRYIQMEDVSPDIVAIAHNHINAISIEELLKKKRILMRTGTRKVTDRYLQKKSYLPKMNVMQTNVAILATDHKEMRIAGSIEEARDLIEFLNSKKEI